MILSSLKSAIKIQIVENGRSEKKVDFPRIEGRQNLDQFDDPPIFKSQGINYFPFLVKLPRSFRITAINRCWRVSAARCSREGLIVVS